MSVARNLDDSTFEMTLCLAALHSQPYNTSNTQTGTHLGDYLLRNDNNTLFNHTKLWSFDVLQELYIRTITLYPRNYALVALTRVNFTAIDEVIIKYRLDHTILMQHFEVQLIQYLGIVLAVASPAALERNLLQPKLNYVIIAAKPVRYVCVCCSSC
jgi:hypothetical protein